MNVPVVSLLLTLFFHSLLLPLSSIFVLNVHEVEAGDSHECISTLGLTFLRAFSLRKFFPQQGRRM